MATVKGTARLERIMFPKGIYETNGGFAIASFKPVQLEEGEIEVNPTFGTFTIKGELPPLKSRTDYHFVVEEGEKHPKFGMGYDLVFMRQDVNLDESDKESVKTFLEIILTKRQVKSLYEAFENPISVIESGNLEELCKADGVGLKTAQRIINHYESQKDYSLAYMELGKFDLTPATIRKVTDFYGSPEVAVQKVKENPYQLMDIDGYAFRKCDAIFMQLGGEMYDEIRIKAFMVYTLQEQVGEGHTWVTPRDLVESAREFIPNVDMTVLGRLLTDDKQTFYMTEDKKRISLASYQKLESLLSTHLHRINNAESKFDYEGWEEAVKLTEEEQGWSFTEQQKEAMLMMLENNISILQGYGGTGKTTTLKAVLDVLEQKGYLYAQAALSGKASQNLTLVTGRDGSTIHRLLGFMPFGGGFHYNARNPLPYDIIIIDEISMVDARIFTHLMMAVRSGAKVIMLGDSEQLESIGVPVMVPMIKSGVIKTMTLTEIHRQAQKSAVIADSIAIRQGKQVLGRETGRVVHGELEDLVYDLIDSDDEIFLHVMREFHKHVNTNGENVMDIQVLTQQRIKGKASCLTLNKACQKVYNPPSAEKEEVQLGNVDKGTDYILREGDKVINIKNNYSATNESGESNPVFNGSVGILRRFDVDEEGDKYMIIDFEGIGSVRIFEDAYRSIELAYTITVHKSQGSSSKIIIIAFPFHFTLNTRQLFYTAITRTRKLCVVISMKATIKKAIGKDDVSNKRTYLADYLNLLASGVKKIS